MAKLTIIVDHVRPPIPYRGNDYSAHVDGREESQQYGWGATAGEAIADLISVLEDHGRLKTGAFGDMT